MAKQIENNITTPLRRQFLFSLFFSLSLPFLLGKEIASSSTPLLSFFLFFLAPVDVDPLREIVHERVELGSALFFFFFFFFFPFLLFGTLGGENRFQVGAEEARHAAPLSFFFLPFFFPFPLICFTVRYRSASLRKKPGSQSSPFLPPPLFFLFLLLPSLLFIYSPSKMAFQISGNERGQEER